MEQQKIKGNANHQTNAKVVNNYHGPIPLPQEPCITESQAFQLRKLVDEIVESTHPFAHQDAKISLWNKLHDYCDTAVPLATDRRSRYRLIPHTKFYRALSFLQEKRIRGLLDTCSKVENLNKSNQAMAAVHKNDHHKIISKLETKITTLTVENRSLHDELNDIAIHLSNSQHGDSIGALNEKIEGLIEELVNLHFETQDLKSLSMGYDKMVKQLRELTTECSPLPDSIGSSEISQVSVWNSVSGTNDCASIASDDESGNDAYANIEITTSSPGGIKFFVEKLNPNEITITCTGEAERKTLAILLAQIARELKKTKKELGGHYRFDAYPEVDEQAIAEFEQRKINCENGD